MRRSLLLPTAALAALVLVGSAAPCALASHADALSATGSSGSTRASGPVVTLSQGHVDAVDVAVENGAFALSVHDESVEPSIERDPSSVRFLVKREAKVTVPDDPDYAFLGQPGSTVWVLPEIQQEDLLWLGLSSEEIAPGVLVGDTLRIRIRSVAGPDGFSMFDTAQDGSPNVLVDSEDARPDVITLGTGIHAHGSYAFEAAGRYRVTYQVTGRLAAGNKPIASRPVTLAFDVQP